MNDIEKYAKELKSKANETTWLPPILKPDGRVENMIQGRIIARGADQGESNYKTRKQPTKVGEYEVELGTFVANKHYDAMIEGTKRKDITGRELITPTGDLVADGDGEIRILKYGKTVRRKNALGWDKVFGKAAENASRYLKDGSAFIFRTQTSESQSSGTGIVQSEAGNAKVSSDGRALNQ